MGSTRSPRIPVDTTSPTRPRLAGENLAVGHVPSPAPPSSCRGTCVGFPKVADLNVHPSAMSENGDSGSSRAANPANGRHFPGESSDSGNPTALFESVVGEKWFSSLAPAYNRPVTF